VGSSLMPAGQVSRCPFPKGGTVHHPIVSVFRHQILRRQIPLRSITGRGFAEAPDLGQLALAHLLLLLHF
jgi:hypothetical protein